jgi:hypothetical protein
VKEKYEKEKKEKYEKEKKEKKEKEEYEKKKKEKEEYEKKASSATQNLFLPAANVTTEASLQDLPQVVLSAQHNKSLLYIYSCVMGEVRRAFLV